MCIPKVADLGSLQAHVDAGASELAEVERDATAELLKEVSTLKREVSKAPRDPQPLCTQVLLEVIGRLVDENIGIEAGPRRHIAHVCIHTQALLDNPVSVVVFRTVFVVDAHFHGGHRSDLSARFLGLCSRRRQ